MDNNNMLPNFGSPMQVDPRHRVRNPLQSTAMNNMYAGQMGAGQGEMWEMGGKCLPNQMAPQPHIQPPPQYPYRQGGGRPGMMQMGGYNSPQNEYMATGLYGQQQPMFPVQRPGPGVMGEPLYPNDSCVPGQVGVRGFGNPMYPGGGMRMGNPYPGDGFQVSILANLRLGRKFFTYSIHLFLDLRANSGGKFRPTHLIKSDNYG
jgi:hypothetical protein